MIYTRKEVKHVDGDQRNLTLDLITTKRAKHSPSIKSGFRFIFEDQTTHPQVPRIQLIGVFMFSVDEEYDPFNIEGLSGLYLWYDKKDNIRIFEELGKEVNQHMSHHVCQYFEYKSFDLI